MHQTYITIHQLLLIFAQHHILFSKAESPTEETLLNNQLEIEYQNIFDDQLQVGVIEEAPTTFIEGKTHYLPHRPVIREDVLTTKVRIVFEASSKEAGESSFNQYLHPGLFLTPSLYGVLMRFHTHPIVFTADIEKVFLQISLNENHRDFVRFIWFQDFDPNKTFEDQKFIVYRLYRVLFGVTSSPFLLQATLKNHIEKQLQFNPEFVYKLLKSLQIDDLLSGSYDITTAHAF